MRRKGIPDGGCSMCCRLKQKLDELWQRTSGCILRIRGITPDGQGDFALEAGTNINITEVSNGVRIDTTGGVSYYSAGDSYIDVDNNDLEISLANPGQPGGVALHDDLDLVAGAVSNILDGTSTVPNATDAVNATNAQYLGSSTNNVGSDTKPIKVVNGVATAVTDDLLKADAGVFGASSGYVQVGDNVYIVFGETTCNYESGGTTTNTAINLPFTVANTNYQPMINIGSASPYWGDVSWMISIRTTTSFTISLRCETTATVSSSITVRWMTVVKKA